MAVNRAFDMRAQFPKTAVLRPGAILGTIANAVMCADTPDFAVYQRWEGNNYLVDGTDGTYGAITFEKGSVVGVFFDAQSDRSPFRLKGAYDIGVFFRGMDASHHVIAQNGALKYWHQLLAGRYVPCVTSAFWDNGEYLMAADFWDAVYENGAHVIRIQLIEDTGVALKEWQDAYQMTNDQVAFVESLWERRLVGHHEQIQLTPAETKWLEVRARDAGAFSVSLKQLERIGIV
jgi:hypothetical protein